MRYSVFSLAAQALAGNRGWTPAWRDAAPKPDSDVLIVGGGGFVGLTPTHHPVEASATVNDLQILDRNEQAFQQMDALQQDDDNGAPTDDETNLVANPAS